MLNLCNMRNVEIIVIRYPRTIIQCNSKTKTSLNCFRHFFVTCVLYGINLISHSLPYYVLFYQTRFNKRWHAIRSSEVRVVSLFLNSFNKSFVYMKCKSHVISNMLHRKKQNSTYRIYTRIVSKPAPKYSHNPNRHILFSNNS